MTEQDAERGPVAASLARIEYLLGAILVLLFFWSISLAKVVMLPLVLGFLIALTLSPVVRGMRRIGVPPPVSAVVLVAMIGAATVFGLWMLSGPTATLIDEVPRIRFELRDKLDDWAQAWRKVQEASQDVESLANGTSAEGEGERIVMQEDGTLMDWALSSMAGVGTATGVALVLAMFLLAAGDMYQRKLVEAFPRLRDKKRALLISQDIERQISRYLAAITVINAGLGFAVGAALHAVGMPYAHLWGVAAFLLNYLPFLGAMTGVAAVAAVSLVTFDTVGQALVAPAAYLALTTLEGQMLTPWLVGRHLQLNAAAVFVAVIFWAWLWGVAGALMAVPFLVFLKVVCDNVAPLRVIGLFLGGRDPLNPPAQAG